MVVSGIPPRTRFTSYHHTWVYLRSLNGIWWGRYMYPARMKNDEPGGMSLKDVVFNYPAIDNHAHPLLKEERRQSLPFEQVISEAQSNAVKDAVHSLPGYRAARQLAELYGLDPGVDWEEIKSHRDTLEYGRLCDTNMQKSGIQCLLLDDGLQGVQEMANDLSWHGRFTNGSVCRLVRIEPVAEVRVRYPVLRHVGIDGVTEGYPEVPLSDRSKRA